MVAPDNLKRKIDQLESRMDDLYDEMISVAGDSEKYDELEKEFDKLNEKLYNLRVEYNEKLSEEAGITPLPTMGGFLSYSESDPPEGFDEDEDPLPTILETLTETVAGFKKSFSGIMNPGKEGSGINTNFKEIEINLLNGRKKIEEKSKEKNKNLSEAFKALGDRISIDSAAKGAKNLGMGALGLVGKAAKKVGSFLKNSLAEGFIGFLIDVLTFKVLQWLANPENQDKIKNILEGIGTVFRWIVKFGKGTFEAVKWSVESFKKFKENWDKIQGVAGFIRRFSDFSLNLGMTVATAGLWPLLKNTDWGDVLKNIKGFFGWVGKFIGVIPKKAEASDSVPTEEQLNMLMNADIPGVDPEAFKEEKDELYSTIDEKELDKANKAIDEVSKAYNSVGEQSGGESGGTEDSKQPSVSESGGVGELKQPSISKSASTDSDSKVYEAVKKESKSKIKPLSETEKFKGDTSSDSVDSTKDMNELMNLPLKAVGSSLIALTLGSVAGTPGMGSIIKPIVSQMAGKFGLGLSSFSKFFAGIDKSDKDFGETMKDFMQVIENIVAYGLGGTRMNMKGTVTEEGSGVEDIEGDVDLSNASDRELLVQLAIAEAKSEGTLGMALVINSVLNRKRILDSGKPLSTFMANDKTIRGIIYGPNQYQPVDNGSINTKWSEADYLQAEQALALARDKAKLEEYLIKEVGKSKANILINATGFRNYQGGAGKDSSQEVNETDYKNHTFNTAGADLKLMRGGKIKGTDKGDKVSALLEPGEYVLNKNSVKLFESIFGKEALDHLNFKKGNRFGEGKADFSNMKMSEMAKKMNINDVHEYKKPYAKKKASEPKTIVIPGKTTNNTNNNEQYYSENALGRTRHDDASPFTSMMFDYV